MFWVAHGLSSREAGHLLNAEEYLSLEQKAANQQGKAKRQERGNQIPQPVMHIFQSGVDFAADEAFRDGFEFHKVVNQIDGDGVHADPDKRPAPVPVILDVY